MNNVAKQEASAADCRFKRGAVVEYWFDDGRGGSLLYGEVTAAGPRTANIKWESGLTNRIRQDSHLVKVAHDKAEAGAAIARRGVAMEAVDGARA